MKQGYKLWKNESIINSSEILKTIYHIGGYLLLSGERKLHSFEIPCECFLLRWKQCLSLLSAAN